MARKRKVIFTKHDAADERMLIALFLSTGRLKVTRCPPGRHERNLSIGHKSVGGVLPAHLNPVTMGEREPCTL